MRDLNSITIKTGTSSVTNEYGIDEARVEGYTDQLAQLYPKYNLLVVSSGSIALGETVWKELMPSVECPDEQPLAMLGSAGIFRVWQRGFEEHRIPAGQLLVSHREIDDSKEGPMLKKVLRDSLQAGIVMIANENDAVSDVEIKKKSYGGDNDGLASRLARLVRSEYLLLLTDTDGVLDEHGEIVREVTRKNIAEVTLLARGPGSRGRGGMREKVKAAKKAANKGVHAIIARAGDDITEMLNGEKGTHFLPKS